MDTGDDRISARTYQVGNKIYFANSFDPGNGNPGAGTGHNAIQWVVLNATTNSVIAQGLIQDGVHDFSYPSIGANANGDIVIGFTRAGPETTDANGDGLADGNLSSFAVVGHTNAGTGAVTFGSPFLLAAGKSAATTFSAETESAGVTTARRRPTRMTQIFSGRCRNWH